MLPEKKFLRQGILIAIFVVIDVCLGSMWLREQKQETLVPVKNFLQEIHPSLPGTVLGEVINESTPNELRSALQLNPQEIFTALNAERSVRKLPELQYSEVISQAGESVVTALIEKNLDLNGVDSSKILATFLQQRKVENMTLYHDTLVGPVNTKQLENYWNEDPQHMKTMASPSVSLVGIATGSAEIQGTLQGIIVTVYGQQQPVPQKTASTTTTPQKIVFPAISSSSILEALNVYRATHHVHQLVEHQKLCEYAEKRVQDLIAFGGLDGHEGFKKDFADSKNLPASIKEYPGGAIGENLAYQHCKNMTTGDSFVAQNATALIEWCFDSSTKGHREAQLNTRFNNVCSRNKDGYFVIIFGE
jgi:uncharacterized protein YkwD